MATQSGCLAPIHDLPNEILVKIFQMHTGTGNPGYSSGNSYYLAHFGSKHRPRPRYASQQWSSLMLVCRHWREIALATPVLWTVVDVKRKTTWLRLAVERSRDAPLELYFHTREAAIDSISLIVSQAHRLRKLLLPILPSTDLPALQIIFRTIMPVLDELRVHLRPSWNDRTLAGTVLSVDSFDTLFPSLRTIRLENISVPWTQPSLFRVRYLTLRNCTALNHDLTFDQFLDVLEGCTELEDLRLHGFLSRTTTHQVPAGLTRVVILPRLQRLTVREPAALCRQLLSALQLPPTIILRVFGQIARNLATNGGAQRLFASMLPEDMSKLPVIHTLKYASVYCSDCEITLSLWSDSHDSREPGSVMLELDWKPRMEHYIPHAIEEFVHLFSPAPLEDVNISVCTPYTVRTTATWSNVFAAFPKVHTLTVRPGQMLAPVWDALAGRQLPRLEVDEDEARAFGPVLLPCLRTLHMECLEWEEDSTLGYILESMRWRAMRGLPKLAELSIDFYETMEENPWAFREIQRMLPLYEESMEEFVENFVWIWS